MPAYDARNDFFETTERKEIITIVRGGQDIPILIRVTLYMPSLYNFYYSPRNRKIRHDVVHGSMADSNKNRNDPITESFRSMDILQF